MRICRDSVDRLPRSVLLVLLIFCGPAEAAICTFSAASGSWTSPANWSGCAAGNGVPSGTPGPADRALIAAATLSFGTETISVGELRLEPGAVLESGPLGPARLIVATRLELAGGRLQGAAGFRDFNLETEPATLTEMSADTLWGSYVRVTQRGSWVQAGSGDNRFSLGGSSRIDNEPGAQWRIQAPAIFEMDSATSGRLGFVNRGLLRIVGPGTAILRGKAAFESFDLDANRGQLIIENATATLAPFVRLNFGLSQQASLAAGPTELILQQGTLSLGGSANVLDVPAEAVVRGNGLIDAALTLYGTLSPGSESSFGQLQISGTLDYAAGTMQFDLGGSGAAQRDAVSSLVSINAVSAGEEGEGRVDLRFRNGFVPAAGEAIPIFSYASSSQLIRGLRRLSYEGMQPLAAGFTATALIVFRAPLLSWADASIVEGASGQQNLPFGLSLSYPTPQPASIRYFTRFGTATPADFESTGGTLNLSTGQQQATVNIVVNGDATVEGDEDFVLKLPRNQLVNLALPSGFVGSPRVVGSILTDELPANRSYVLVAKGSSPQRVRRYLSDGTFIDQWDNGATTSTGLCRGSDHSLYSTRFTAPSGVVGLAHFSRFGALRHEALGGGFSAGAGFNAESCVLDGQGRVLVGHATDPVAGGAGRLARLGVHGEFERYFELPVGPRGSDWVELDPNGCTLHYTSEGPAVLRYDLCADASMPALIKGLEGPCFALRQRSNGEIVLACRHAVHRIEAGGSLLASYSRQQIGEASEAGLFALDLDPDGSSFWVGGEGSGNVYRVRIDTGAVLGQFATGSPGVGGLLVQPPMSVVVPDALFSDGFEP